MNCRKNAYFEYKNEWFGQLMVCSFQTGVANRHRSKIGKIIQRFEIFKEEAPRK
jgi:hypothetical protein